MTHEELLAEIDRKDTTFGSTGRELSYYDKINHALYAVVELHKPSILYGKATNICEAHEQCWGCGEWGSSKDCPCDKYPCPTIQAIEEQLQ